VPLLLTDAALDARRAIAAGPLAPLTLSLAQETARVAERGAWVPTWAPRFTRGYARCTSCGGPLRFDPWSPHRHACALADHVTVGGDADGWWATGALLWAGDRAVHAATLAVLTDDAVAHDVACTLLEALVLHTPARSGLEPVLGPAGTFFSTYLDSLWVLSLAVACDLLAADARRRSRLLGATVRARQVAALVAEQLLLPMIARREGYDEGRSNRQVWNDAAALAVARLTGDDGAAARLLDPAQGALARATVGLLADGSWYEGENYHQFAVRGLWYLVRLHEAVDAPVPRALRERLDLAWRLPLDSCWPDDTLFARRDAQYAVSLHQWRWAEWFELARADAPHPRLDAALVRLYRADAHGRDADARLVATGESETNRPPARQSRATLGWKSLLFARPEPPAPATTAPGGASTHLAQQGLAVVRRGGARGPRVVALDYGATGGGHGHADRLQLLFADGDRRLLDDWGTGTYADPALGWYRSALAHTAPIVNGGGDAPVPGRWVGHDDRAAASWMAATVDAPRDAVTLRRDVVLLDGYLVDLVAWKARHGHTVRIDLPVPLARSTLWTAEGGAVALRPFDLATVWREASPDGHIDDGARFAHEGAMAPRAAGAWGRLSTPGGPTAWVGATRNGTWWRVATPGAPRWSAAGGGTPTGPRHGLSADGVEGRIATVWDVDGVVHDVRWEDDVVCVHLADGTTHRHRAERGGWHVGLWAPKGAGRDVASSSIDLAPMPAVVAHGDRGEVAGAITAPREAMAAQRLASVPCWTVPFVRTASRDAPPSGAARVVLGADAFWRGDASWGDYGRPMARLHAWHDGASLLLHVEVDKVPLVAADPGAASVLDGWPADVHGDGVWWRLVDGSGAAGEWVVTPAGASGRAQVRAIDPAGPAVTATWGWRPAGWWLRTTVDAPRRWQALAAVVTLRRAGRARRDAALACPPQPGWVYGLADRVGSSLPAMPITCADA
jgi:hypothetical protein